MADCFTTSPVFMYLNKFRHLLRGHATVHLFLSLGMKQSKPRCAEFSGPWWGLLGSSGTGKTAHTSFRQRVGNTGMLLQTPQLGCNSKNYVVPVNKGNMFAAVAAVHGLVGSA